MIAFALLYCSAGQIAAQDLIPELEVLKPIVNQEWIGRFENPEETMEIYLKLEVILKGSAIRQTQNIQEAEDFRSETLYYWDPEAKAIAYIRITNNRYLFKGFVRVSDAVLVYEGVRYSPDGSSSNTRSERYFDTEGNWIEKGGHTIIYKRK